jgi:tRNA-binding protein
MSLNAGADLKWETFKSVDIRIGTIVEATPFPKARKPAYRLLIDFGELGRLKSSAQITTHYTTDELTGKQVVAVVNFPPKQVANFISECLILGAYAPDGSVILLKPDVSVENGAEVG